VCRPVTEKGKANSLSVRRKKKRKEKYRELFSLSGQTQIKEEDFSLSVQQERKKESMEKEKRKLYLSQPILLKNITH
jgi:outer membrane usher protein FimD/PapC